MGGQVKSENILGVKNLRHLTVQQFLDTSLLLVREVLHCGAEQIVFQFKFLHQHFGVE